MTESNSNNNPISIDLVINNRDSRYVDSFKPTNKEGYLFYETVPEEEGRYTLISIDNNGNKVDLVPKEFDLHTLVHEYGGNSITILNEAKCENDNNFLILFSDYSTQELYTFYPYRKDQLPKKLTFSNGGNSGIGIGKENKLRFSDGTFDEINQRVVLICEDHSNIKKVENYLVEINLNTNNIKTIESGFDFYTYPRFNSDGSKLSFISWNFPNMPWDNVTLNIRDMNNGNKINVGGNGKNQSIIDPKWNKDEKGKESLYYISDLNGYYTIYKYNIGKNNEGKELIKSCTLNFRDIGEPMWYTGKSFYGFLTPNIIIGAIVDYGLVIFDIKRKEVQEIIKNEYSIARSISASPSLSTALIIGGSSSNPYSPVLVNYDQALKQCTFKQLLPNNNLNVGSIPLSIPIEIEFNSENGEKCFAYYYPPSLNNSSSAPPVLIKSHGGPTDRCYQVLNLEYQYWTSRGWAVIDVNYRGSSGFGKRYRNLLYSNWGIYDVQDCVNAALHAVKLGYVDRDKLFIDGGSAGGYTTLSCLIFRSEIFKAGCSYYGVADLEQLFAETHKFESRYQDTLIVPMNLEEESTLLPNGTEIIPEWKRIYRERSPIYHLDKLRCPIALFHGRNDHVVPYNQSVSMYNDLISKGIESLLELNDEGHGFQSKVNIIKTLEYEYQFFCKLLNISAIGIQYNILE